MACERTIFFAPGESEPSSVFSTVEVFEAAVRGSLPPALRHSAAGGHGPARAPSRGHDAGRRPELPLRPRAEKIRSLDAREMFRRLPVSYRICRIYAENAEHAAELSAVMDKLTASAGADDATNM